MIKKIWKRVKPWSVPICLTLLCYVLLQHVFLLGYVPSASMEPTLQEGSFIFGLRIFETPTVGDRSWRSDRAYHTGVYGLTSYTELERSLPDGTGRTLLRAGRQHTELIRLAILGGSLYC